MYVEIKKCILIRSELKLSILFNKTPHCVVNILILTSFM